MTNIAFTQQRAQKPSKPSPGCQVSAHPLASHFERPSEELGVLIWESSRLHADEEGRGWSAGLCSLCVTWVDLEPPPPASTSPHLSNGGGIDSTISIFPAPRLCDSLTFLPIGAWVGRVSLLLSVREGSESWGRNNKRSCILLHHHHHHHHYHHSNYCFL